MRAPRHASLILAAICASALAMAGSAQANAPIISYSALPSSPQAGGHPDVEISFSVETRITQKSQSPCNCEDAEDANVHLPAGFIGNPHATPQCSLADFSAEECPIDSQTGTVEIESGGTSPFVSAVYNVVPPPDVAGLVAFKIIAFAAPQFAVISARTGGDYGLDARASGIFHGLGLPLERYNQVLWGVPAAPSHDPLRVDTRFTPGNESAYFGFFCDANGSPSTSDPNTVVKPCGTNTAIPPATANTPPTPFLQNPTTCDVPLSSSLDVLSYDGGIDTREMAWPQMTGCDQLSFNPSLYAQPTTTETDSPSGIDVNLTVPQQQSTTIPSPTELKGAIVTLPTGFSINPNAADGKTSCSDAQARFGTEEEAHCPDFAKVGSLTIDSPALPGPLPGFVYLGEPLPGNRYRIFLIANGFAVHIKLAGTVTPDPQTGQIVVTFENLPQSPFSAFNMHFFGSERGLLATPTECGSYPVTTKFVPWDASLAAQTSTQYFTLENGPYGAPCPGSIRPFNPTLQAASSNHAPGGHSPFSLELRRTDGDQNLAGLTVNTPPGFSATLAGIPYCPDAALALVADQSYTAIAEQETSVCPTASQVGTAMAGAGAGNHPVYVPGKVYLAGPYKGAPLSLAVITPALSGPYDLGNVVVRVALRIDPTDAHITAVSDPLPQILQGIPLRLRAIRINLDRPEFAINPTNCDPFAIEAAVLGDQGTVANLSEHFQLANCGTLPFEPKLALSFTGGKKRTQHPALTAVLKARPGEANIARTSVALPNSEILDNAHIQLPCTRVQFAANACPANSVLGFAKAVTPLLEKPLEGPVYLRSSSHKLPDIVADLKGQVEIVLVGRVDTVHRRLRTTFDTVPDTPVTEFVLSLRGGSKGLLQNVENICARDRIALEKMDGQNGKHDSTNATVATPCSHERRRNRRHKGTMRRRSESRGGSR
jgi:hypothetical protein